MPDLALADEALDRAGNVLDRHVRINTMLIEQVDGIDLQALQRGLGDLPYMLRPAVEALLLARVRIDGEPEFSSNDDFSAERGQRLADKFFISKGAVDFGGIEEGHP